MAQLEENVDFNPNWYKKKASRAMPTAWKSAFWEKFSPDFFVNKMCFPSIDPILPKDGKLRFL